MRIPEYHSFGDLWQQHIYPHRAQFYGDAFPTVANSNANEPTLDAVIHLIGWPNPFPNTGVAMSPRGLDILVHARERFGSEKPPKVFQSNIKVTYFRVGAVDNIAEPLSTIRYDYDRRPLVGHPVYHSQCSNDPVIAARLPRSWRYAMGECKGKTCFPFRVPTPHMCLCNVLIGLVADLLPSEHFKNLWDAIKSKGWVPPLAEHCDLWDLLSPNTYPRVLHNWQWYFWPS